MTVTNEYYTKGTIEYSTGKYSGNFEYGSVSGLNNLKKESDVCKLSVGKETATKNRPAKLTLKDFGISLPTGAEVSNVVVEYAHRKVKGSNQSKAPNILAPTISLVGFGSANNPDEMGVAPTTEMKNRSVTFKFKPTKEQVESKNFGVHIKYPKNNNDASGHIELKYIRIKINYVEPKYQLTMLPNRSNISVGETNEITVSIGNLNGTNYKPSIPITLDSGVTFDKVIDGTIHSSNNQVIWNPQVSSSWLGMNAVFKVYGSTSGTKTIRMSFTLNGVTYSSSCSFTVNPPKAPESTSTETGTPEITDNQATPPSTEVLQVEVNQEFAIDLNFENYYSTVKMYACLIKENGFDSSPTAWEWWATDNITENIYAYVTGMGGAGVWRKISTYNGQSVSHLNYDVLGKVMKNRFKCTTPGEYVIVILDSDNNLLKKINLSVRPSNVTKPITCLFRVTGEELNRLGDGVPYYAASSLKILGQGIYVRDWIKNFRIGVFNNSIEKNIVRRLDYNCFDDVAIINIDFGEFENSSDYMLILTPSEEIEVATDYDGDNDTYIYSTANPNVDNIFNLLNELRLKCIEDSFNLDAKIINTNNDSIEWEQTYYVNLNTGVADEIKEVVIDHNDYENLTLEDITDNAEYWSSPMSVKGVFEEKHAEFNYDEKYPLYIIITGDHSESPNSESIDFTAPIIYEHGSLDGNNHQVNFPVPIRNILENGEISTLEIPSGKSSNPFVLYEFNVGEFFQTGDNLAIRGLIFTMNIDYTDDLILTAKLKSPDGKIGTRSKVIQGFNSTENQEDNRISIGGSFELWGFKISEMVNLDDWELIIQVDNPYPNEDGVGTLMFSDVTLSFYYLTFLNDLVIMRVNGEDSRHYGMFIQNVNVPHGLNADVKYYEIVGSDFNNAYRMNIDKADIEVEFTVEACTIFESSELLKDIAKLLVNKRDKMNEPIPNRVEFSNYPGEHWDYIMEDPIDTDIESANFDSKIKLIVPDGTGWANEDSVTGINGYNNSIAGVNPIIEVSPVGNFIQLTENITGQKFSLKYENYNEGDIIIIDCVNRIVTLKQYDSSLEKFIDYDISENADYTVDWFILPIGEYSFDTHGTCRRCTVTFTERR